MAETPKAMRPRARVLIARAEEEGMGCGDVVVAGERSGVVGDVVLVGEAIVLDQIEGDQA